jgi:hypothetical protein
MNEGVVRAHEPSGLPWRGPAPGRPDLPLPPDPMPLLRNGRLRKRWRYIGVYGAEVMLCAAKVEVGPLPQSFWAVWDREERRRWAHTRNLPGGQVEMDGPLVRLDAGEVRAELRFGAGEAIESVCASGDDGYAWTRKRAGVEVSGRVEAGGSSWPIDGADGVEDISAGYHRRHTDWMWSAGVGEDSGGRAIAWNLVTGINDPPRGSERAIWVDGTPTEPEPVRFEGLEAIGFADGSRLHFTAESERARDDNLLLVRSRYRHRFGSFEGALPGIELRRGFGVMEEHSAVW